jgi:hypothetical protein
MQKFPLTVLAAAILAGCGGTTTLIPDEDVMIAPGFTPPVEAVVFAALVGVTAYYVIEPTAPNWELRITQLDETRVAIDLRKKRFSTGGDGEARLLLARKAQELAEENGFSGYALLSFVEGVESETLGARRVAHGVVRLEKPPA